MHVLKYAWLEPGPLLHLHKLCAVHNLGTAIAMRGQNPPEIGYSFLTTLNKTMKNYFKATLRF